MKNKKISTIFLALATAIFTFPLSTAAQQESSDTSSLINYDQDTPSSNMDAIDSAGYEVQGYIAEDTMISSVPPIPNYNIVNTSQWVPQSDYQTLQIKSKCTYSGPDLSQSFTANIKIEKDKKIWISVVGAGVLEVARALITPDSAIVLNRLQSIAYVQDYQSIKNLIQLDVDFYTLQSILSNQLPAEMPAEVETKGDEVHLDFPVNSYINSDFGINTTKKIWQTLALTFTQGDVKDAMLDFEDYNSDYGYPVAMTRKVKVNENKGKHDLTMTVNKVVVDEPLDLSLVIPERYQIQTSF